MGGLRVAVTACHLGFTSLAFEIFKVYLGAVLSSLMPPHNLFPSEKTPGQYGGPVEFLKYHYIIVVAGTHYENPHCRWHHSYNCCPKKNSILKLLRTYSHQKPWRRK